MKKVCISFKTFTDMNFQKKGVFIYNSLYDNSLYVTLSALLVVVKTALDKYIVDLAAAASNDRNAVAQKNKSRAELATLLKQLGLAVMAEAKGDEAMLISSGFTLEKTREANYITNPGNVTLSLGISTGEALTTVKAVKGAKSYVFQIAGEFPVDDSKWASTTATGSKFVFTNLVPGKQYWIRVAVIGSRKQIAYSNVATWFAQ